MISRFFPINASGVCDVSDHTAPQHINSWSSIPMCWSIVSSMSLTNRYLWFVTSVCMNTHTHIYICTHTQQFGDIAKSWSRTKACISYIIRKTTYHQKRWLYGNGSDGFMICPHSCLMLTKKGALVFWCAQELIYVYPVWTLMWECGSCVWQGMTGLHIHDDNVLDTDSSGHVDGLTRRALNRCHQLRINPSEITISND